MGEIIQIEASAGGGSFSAYLAKPENKSGPGLLLIQEIFGVNSHIRDVANLFAQDGFVVLAPDIFWRIEPGVELGYDANTMQKGRAIVEKLDDKLLMSDIADTTKKLRSLSSSPKVGVCGYCFGGTMAYRIAAAQLVDASVSYYGGKVANYLDQAKNVQCPMIMHFAGNDDHIPLSTIISIRDAFAKMPNVHVIVYNDVEHGFNCDQRGTYNRQAAMLAFARSSAFLHKNLN
jgi:carboxymethylenebutenolidase